MIDRELYQKVILEHNKYSRNEGTIEKPTHQNKSYNPFCGDEIEVYLVIEDNRIVEIKQECSGCSISRASASMMSEAVLDKMVDEALGLFSLFQKLVKGEFKDQVVDKKLGKLEIFQGVWHYPARVKCAILPWHSLKKAIENEKETTIMEE